MTRLYEPAPHARIWQMLRLVFILAFIIATGEVRAAGDAKTGPGTLTVTYLNMPEHGLAVVLQTPSQKTWLIDTGHHSDAYDAGRDTIGPFLKARGIARIDGIAISHPHGDHYGGAQWLLDHLPVKEFVDTGYSARGFVLEYGRLRQRAQERGAHYMTAHAGDNLKWDDRLTVEVLSPPEDLLETGTDPAKITEHGLLNTNSLFLRVQHGKNVFFFPGDAYGAGQRYVLAQTRAEKLKASVVTAAHHGFNTSPEFAAATRPKYAIASCLPFYKDHKPGDQPAEVTEKLFTPLGTEVFATAWHGNITITSDGETVTAATEHEKRVPPASN